MGLTPYEDQVLFGGASSVTLNTATLTWSDAITFDDNAVYGSIMVSADNQSTPSNGDIVEVWVSYTCGDVLGDTGNDYDTDEHAKYYGAQDTYPSNTPGEDPCRRAYPLDVANYKGLRVGVRAPQGATHSIVVRVQMYHRRLS